MTSITLSERAQAITALEQEGRIMLDIQCKLREIGKLREKCENEAMK